MPDYDLGTARGKIEIDAKGATTGVGEAKTAVRGLDSDMSKAAGTIGKAGLAIGGIGVVAVAGFGLAVKAAQGFEKGLSAIEAVSGATGDQMEGVRKKALKLGADTKFSASEAASAMEELVKAGIPLEGVINGAADATVALAAAGEIALPEAATIAANAMNQFGLAAKDMPHIADLIAGAANASAIDVSDFGMSMSQAGATANLVGLKFDDLAVSVAAMGNAGIKGSDAGTSLKTFLSNLQPTTEKQITLMQKLGLVTKDGGNAFFDASGKIKSMANIAGTLQNALRGQTEQQKAMTLETIFGSDAIRAAAIIADTGADGMNKLAAAMGKVSAEDVAAKRMDNFAGSMEQLKGSLETVAIQIGSVLLPVLKTFADVVTSLVNKFSAFPAGMQTAIVVAGLLIGSLALLTGAMLLGISTYLKAKTAITEFREAMQALELASKRQAIAQKLQTAATLVSTAATAAFNAVIAANPIVLVVAALIALGVALFVLYKKWKPFHDLVDATWRFIKNFVMQLGRLWTTLVGGTDIIQGVSEVFDNMFGNTGKLIKPLKAVLNVFKEVFNWLKSNWDIVLAIVAGPFGLIILIVRRFGDDIVGFFKALPGRLAGFFSEALQAFVSFMVQLPERAAFFLGFLIGAYIRAGFEIAKFFVMLGINILGIVIRFMMQLPGRVIGFLDAVWDGLYAFGVRFVNTAKKIGIDVVEGIIGFIIALPGRVIGLLDATWDGLFQFGVNVVNKAKEIGAAIVSGIINFVTALPGRVAGFFASAVSAIASFIPTTFGKAQEIGSGIIDGVINFAKDLPNKIKEIITNMIDKIKGAAGAAFDAMKNIGGSLWDGFKKGLGIGSPSLPERAVTEMVKNIGAEMRPLARHIDTIQGLAASLPNADATLAVGVGAGVLQPAAASSAGLSTPDATQAAAPYIGELNILNPVGEPSEQSLTRTMQHLEYAGYFG